MVCTVTIMRVLPSPWLFLSCAGCHKTAYIVADQFICSDQECKCVAANPRYRVRVIGADCTGETEFVFFAGIAEQIIGKRVETLTRTAARRPETIPAEIAALVSQKYTINVSVNQRGLRYGELSFQVNNIELIHGTSKSFEFAVLGLTSKQQENAPSCTESVQPILALDKVGSTSTPDTSSSPDNTHAETNMSVKVAEEMATLAAEVPPSTPASVPKNDTASRDNIGSLEPKLPMKRAMDSSQKSSVSKNSSNRTTASTTSFWSAQERSRILY